MLVRTRTSSYIAESDSLLSHGYYMSADSRDEDDQISCCSASSDCECSNYHVTHDKWQFIRRNPYNFTLTFSYNRDLRTCKWKVHVHRHGSAKVYGAIVRDLSKFMNRRILNTDCCCSYHHTFDGNPERKLYCAKRTEIGQSLPMKIFIVNDDVFYKFREERELCDIVLIKSLEGQR